MTTNKSYLRFIEEGRSDSGLTLLIGVYPIFDPLMRLGEIKWYAPWRRYVFYPVRGMLFDARCLENLADKCDRLMVQHRDARTPRRAMSHAEDI
jgi:hypothetical protein